jgi:hypothetical protein
VPFEPTKVRQKTFSANSVPNVVGSEIRKRDQESGIRDGKINPDSGSGRNKPGFDDQKFEKIYS